MSRATARRIEPNVLFEDSPCEFTTCLRTTLPASHPTIQNRHPHRNLTRWEMAMLAATGKSSTTRPGPITHATRGASVAHRAKPRRDHVESVATDRRGCEEVAVNDDHNAFSMTDGGVLLGAGHCGITESGPSDCTSHSKGSWPLRSEHIGSIEACHRRCRQCERCNYVSYSTRNDECAWYYRCPNLRTIGAGGDSYES